MRTGHMTRPSCISSNKVATQKYSPWKILVGKALES